MAGEALAVLSDQSESNATVIFKASDTIVKDLTEMLLPDDEMEIGYLTLMLLWDDKMKRGCTISAAEILENLYIRYTKDDDHLKKLTEAMKDVLPKLLREILLLLPWKRPEKAEKETDGGKLSAQNADIESQCSVASNNKQNNLAAIIERNVDRKLYAALLSLSATIFEKLTTNHKDLAQLDDTIPPFRDPAFSFAGKLKEVVQRHSERPTANCLRILKITTRMTISLINLEGGCNGEDLESLMQSLLDASKAMLELEGIMIVCSSDHSATKPVCILASLVKEAQDLLEKKKQAQNMAATPALLMEAS
ncbi:hypothetical protein ABZP36_034080 [Zizania latifolia]